MMDGMSRDWCGMLVALWLGGPLSWGLFGWVLAVRESFS